MSYCGECGTPVSGVYCGNCGARSGHPDADGASWSATNPASTQPMASAPVFTPTQPIAAVPPQEPPPKAAPPIVAYPSAPPFVAHPSASAQLNAAAPDPLRVEEFPLQPLPDEPPGRRRGRRSLIAVIVAAVLLLAGGGYAAAKMTILKDPAPVVAAPQPNGSGQATPTGTPLKATPSASAPSAATVTVTATATPTTAPTPSVAPPVVDPRAAAFGQLETLVAQDAARPTVHGQWVAQLSSKSEGILDATLQPAPFTVPDILAEHLRLRSDPGFGSLIRVVHLGDWGHIATPASPMWISAADINAGSAAEVSTWCQAHFAQRGKALDNVCVPRQFTQKSG